MKEKWHIERDGLPLCLCPNIEAKYWQCSFHSEEDASRSVAVLNRLSGPGAWRVVEGECPVVLKVQASKQKRLAKQQVKKGRTKR